MKRSRRTTVLAVGCSSLILGVGFARLSYSFLPIGWVLLALPMLVVALTSKSRFLPLACIIFAGFSIGWWRGGQTLYQVRNYENVFGEKVIVEVKADSDGAFAGTPQQFTFDASNVTIIEPEQQEMVGRITVAGFGTTDIRRGDTVRAEGKLYPTIGGKMARISYAQMKVVERSDSLVEKIRRKFLASLRSVLPEPQASFGTGLLIGQTRELPQEYVDVLRIVGLSHIIAVSGYNLTILASVLNRKLGKKSKFRSLVISLVFIGVFVLLAGTSASIARAAVVAVLSAVAAYYGRKFKPLLLILLVAAGSALLNPLNLWGDIGWYLSFLAFFGVLVLAPAIQKKIWKDKEPKLLWAIAIESFSAQIMTLPYLLFVFGQLSVVALPVNLIVLPFIPAAMLLTTVAGIAGMLPIPNLALVIAWPASLVLKAILDTAVLFSRIPYASVPAELSLGFMILVYMLIVAIVILLTKSAKIIKTDTVIK